MNRIYRLIWNASLSATALAHADPALNALPSAGQVVRGDATLQASGSRLDITQSSQRAVIDWQSFDIGRDASVNFTQPSSSAVALNRVLSSSPAQLFGQLHANGQVFLSSPSGVLIGPDARVDVGGLVATSMQIDSDDFMTGHYRFTRGSGPVVNRGVIHASDGGLLALMAPEVRNEGVLSARLGTVALAAGDAVTLQIDGDRQVAVQVDPATVDVLIENHNLIEAQGGRVLLSASAAERLIDTAIPGASGATGLVVENGTARLIDVGGTVRAGSIAVDGGDVGITRIAGTLDASSTDARGGDILVTGDKVLIDSGAALDASGRSGGTVLVGGGERGADPNVRNAERVFVSSDASIRADGGRDTTQSGRGGRVIVYSDESTQIGGTLTARAGSSGGDGGFIETSGGWLDVSSVPDASAPAGRGGEWLIDPYNITIQAAGSDTSIGSSPNWASTADSAILTASSIQSALNAGTSVTVTTGSGGSQGGDITIADPISKTSGGAASLTFNAHRDIAVNAAIGSSSGALSLTFNADTDNDLAGAIVLASNLTTLGGSVNFLDGTVIGGGSALSINTSGGAGGTVNFNGQVLIGNSNGVTITTGGGDVNFASLVDSGNAYALINSNVTWANARTAAASGTGLNVGDTYLATITSPLEMSRAAATANYAASWLGGSDSSTEGTWRWVTGPEGLENGGLGRIFYVGNRSGVGSALTGNNGYGGAYVNWNGGEPNDYGGAEDALQLGFGAAGQWNDLPTNSSTLPYVRETVLAPSPLTISAGAGNITFNGDVGTNKMLGTLTLTNSGTVNLNANTVSVSGNVNLNSGGAVVIGATNSPTIFADDGSINVDRSILKSAGADAALELRADSDIFVRSSAAIGSTSNRLNVTLDSDRDGTSGGAVVIDTASINTNGGNLVIGGGTNPSTTAAVGTAGSSRRGVFLAGATLDAGAGNITITGRGDNVGIVSAAPGIGVDIVTASTIQTSTGTVTINGTGSGGSNDTNLGISVFNGSTVRSTDGGNVNLTGTASATGDFAAGINIELNSTAAALGGGSLSLTGTGSSTGANSRNHGVYLQSSSSALASGSGTLSITGTAGAGSSGIATLTGSNLIGNSSGFSGNLTLTADTMSLANLSVRGTGALLVRPLNTATTIGIGDSASGTLNLTNTELALFQDGFSSLTFGRSDGTGDIDVRGYTFTDAVTFTSSGAGDGDITVNGDLRNTGGSISLEAGDTISVATTGDITTQGAAITLNSDRDASGAGSIALASGAALTTSGGNITLRGGSAALSALADPTSNAAGFLSTLSSTGARGSGTHGIDLSGATLNAGGGNIDVRGAGGDGYRGVNIGSGSSITTTGSGTIAIHGVGGTSGSENDGVQISGSATTVATQNGELRVQGLGRGGSSSQGIAIITPGTASSATLSAANGTLVLRGASSATGNTDQGIVFDTLGSAQTTGTGNVDIAGIGGGTSAGVGVHLLNGAAVRTTGGGDLSITGYGSSSGTGTNNEGVKVDASTVEAQTGSNADLTLLGYGGTGTSYNIGVNVRVGGIVRMGASAGGLMSISGTGGNGNTTGNWGVLAESDGIYESLGGAPIRITGIGGSGTDNAGIRVTGGSGNRIGSSSMTGDITLIADSMDLQGSGVLDVRSSGALVIQPYAAATSIGIGNSASGTLNLNSTELSRLANGFSQITIGRADGTGAISVTGGTFSDNLRLLNTGAGSAGIGITGALALGSNDLWLSSNGPVTQTAGLSANRLLLTGPGAYALTNASNAINTLAASSGALSFRNNGSLSIGSIPGNGTTYSGITSSGAVSLVASGATADMALLDPISATGTGTSLQLAAGRNFANSYGTGALNAGSGRWLVWSSTPADDVRGGLAYDFKQYAATYGVTTPAQLSGNGFLYSTAPSLTAVLTGTTSRVYDGTRDASLSAANFAVTGALDGDTVSLSTPATGLFDTKNAGTGKTVDATGVVLTSVSNGAATVYGYQLASANASGSIGEITPRSLTAGLTGSTSKTYDGTDVAALAEANYTLTGVLGSDAVTLGAPSAGAYDTPNVGTGKTVTANGLALGGADAGNYMLGATSASAGIGEITPKGLVVTANDDSRIYGDANPDFTARYEGFVAGEDESVLGGTLAFSTPATVASDVGTYAVSTSGLASSNYALTYAPGTLAITPAPLIVTANDQSKMYGDADPTLTMTVGGAGLRNGDGLTGALSAPTGSAATAGNHQITQGSVAASSNYDLTFVPGTLAVSRAPLVITADDQSRITFTDNPDFTSSVSGLRYDDDRSVVSGLDLRTDAARNSAPGSYAIVASGAQASNYDIAHVNGVLNVLARSVVESTPNVATITTTVSTNETAIAPSPAAISNMSLSSLGPSTPVLAETQSMEAAIAGPHDAASNDTTTASTSSEAQTSEPAAVAPTQAALNSSPATDNSTSLRKDAELSAKAAAAERTPAPRMSGNFVAVETLEPVQLPANGTLEFTLPADTFRHSDPNAPIVISALCADGSPLPGWVTYDAERRVLTGTPPADVNELAVLFVARDNMGSEARTTMTVRIVHAPAK